MTPQSTSIPVGPPVDPTHDRPVALVTGGVKRVGLATALEFARAGYDLILTFNRSEAEAATAAERLRAIGAAVRCERLDLADLGGLGSVANRLAAGLPRLDVLVHNASVYDRTPLESVMADDLIRHYAVHAAGPLLLSRELVPLLRASPQAGGGAIVAMADIHALGEHGLPRREGFGAYAMSKAALVEMVRTLARELAPRVRVNALAPGVVAWPDSGHESDAAAQAEYLRRVPLARAGTPEEAAKAVLFLARDATYTTGHILRIDGGRSML